MPKCPSGQTYNRILKICRDKKKPGPTKKRRCPVGQTYNRTAKACRDYKKRGRKVRAVSPVRATSPKMIKFTFTASTRAGPNADIISKLLEWYRNFADNFADEYPGMEIKYLKKGEFEGTYIIDASRPHKYLRMDIESFVDPDDDGNYPIVVNGKKYNVVGKLLTINNEPVTDDE